MSSDLCLFKSASGEVDYMASYDEVLRFWPIPFESFYVPTRFGKTHVLVSGPLNGKPLILLHGASTSATMWSGSIGKLAQQFRNYAIDVMGEIGKSVPTHPILTNIEAAQWLIDVLDQLNIDRADFAGMSKGAWLAMNFGLYSPKRINRVVLLAPAFTFIKTSLKFYYKTFKLVLFTTRLVFEDYISWISARPFFRNELHKSFGEQMFIGMKNMRFQKGVIPKVLTDDELNNFNIPVLVLLGEKEVIYDPEVAAERARKLMPNVKVQIVSEAGHNLVLDQPDIVCELILDYLL